MLPPGGYDVDGNEEYYEESEYPFNVEDSDANIVFTPETVQQPRPAIKGATLEKLIERMTYHKYPGNAKLYICVLNVPNRLKNFGYNEYFLNRPL
jgi:hypothetical protein